MTTCNEKKLLEGDFAFKQGLLLLRHVDGVSAALLAKAPYLRDPLRGEGEDVGLTI